MSAIDGELALFLDRDDVRGALQRFADELDVDRADYELRSTDLSEYLTGQGIADATDHPITVELVSFSSRTEREQAERSREQDGWRLVCKSVDPPICIWVRV